MSFRVGNGIDVHQWEDGKELKLGGVPIPYERGLKAHSDGDALLHAITDAILGAAGLGDIGEHFPDTDPEWKGADSGELLVQCVKKVAEAGYRIVNVDSTVVAEKPKLSQYKAEIQIKIAELLGIDSGAVSVKATTCEKMGFLGREEGLLAMATVLIEDKR